MSSRALVLRRISVKVASSLILLLFLISFVFILLVISPGDPTLKFLSPEFSPELSKNIRESFGIGGSVFQQYFIYITNIFRGEFGISFTYRQPVLQVIYQFLPFTITFAFIAFFIQITFALLFSYFGFIKKERLYKILEAGSMILFSLPSFVLGLLLIWLFSEKLNFFPSSGLVSYDHDSLSFMERIFEYFTHLILPLLTLTAGGIAVFYRYMSDNMSELNNKLFIQNLQSYGIKDKEIIKRHIIPNSLSPLISAGGIELGILLGGTLITEVIFSLPGMGRLTLNSVLARDYPLASACILTTAVLVMISNIAADFTRRMIDKRYSIGRTVGDY